MTGQDAVNSAQDFHERLGLTGVVLTKMDGDARGGAALSIRHVTGQPIKFIGVGEKPDAFEPFHPDRIVGRILGMGDMLSLIEKAESTLDRKSPRSWPRRLSSATASRSKTSAISCTRSRSSARWRSILKMLPSVGPFAGMQQAAGQVDEKQFIRLEAIINSMTPQERRNHEIISGTRRKRIAAGTAPACRKSISSCASTRRWPKCSSPWERAVSPEQMLRGGMGSLGMGPEAKVRKVSAMKTTSPSGPAGRDHGQHAQAGAAGASWRSTSGRLPTL